jgi:hypothetical protein
VPNQFGEGLEGTTLTVYSFVVKQGKPVGTRDVMRGAGLSSSSVAHRHLQKLESLGLLQRNEYGDYIVEHKTKVRGYIWVGRRLLPRMLIYAFVFMSVLLLEIAILFIHLEPEAENYQFTIFFLIITLITTVAMVIFLVEGILQIIRSKRNRTVDS